MGELLLEIFSEEIPARMQARAAEDLKRLVTDRLAEARLSFREAVAYVTPRRLTLVVEGLPAKQPDAAEERKGPRVGAPDQAVRGFLKSAGLTSLDQCEQRDTGKGLFWFAVTRKPGRPTAAVLPALVAEAVAALSWPKSMRWSGGPGYSLGLDIGTKAVGLAVAPFNFRWVRPLRAIVCLFGGQTVEGGLRISDADVVEFNNSTRGHRFLAPEPFTVSNFTDYSTKLRNAYVILDTAERRAIITHDAVALAAHDGLLVKDDPALLDEVAGLVEWPVVLMGRIDESFMALPPEVLITSMRAHQKYFSLVDREGRLAPRFLVVSNMETADDGRAIVAGNERVLRARLADAKFFWDQDRKTKLEERVPALKDIVFHAKLGTVADKVQRVQTLAAELVPHIPGAELDKVRSAALLAKADLTTGMVGEFPELQGIMGRYYALGEGEDPAVADAVAEHYAPLGPSDRCPTAPVSIAVALADKIDTLVGFFAIDEKPTGSKDPYALRRAALGIIRLIIENRLRFKLEDMLFEAYRNYFQKYDEELDKEEYRSDVLKEISHWQVLYRLRSRPFWHLLSTDDVLEQLRQIGDKFWNNPEKNNLTEIIIKRIRLLVRLMVDDPLYPDANLEKLAAWPYQRVMEYLELETSGTGNEGITDDGAVERRVQYAQALHVLRQEYFSRFSGSLLDFFADRLKVALREQGVRHDLISAVFALGGEDDLVRLLARVEALRQFLDSEDGADLLTAYRRASNIVRIEEKKDKASYSEGVDRGLLRAQEEQKLYRSLNIAREESSRALAVEDFGGAMEALARLRQPVDAFFDKVTVNTEDPDLRANRLRLLSRIRATLGGVADFSRIEG